MSNTKTVMSQAANTLAKPLEVEDVFSTYLYTGDATTRDIVNNIDLAGEGGLVWIKTRNAANGHFLFDTERGVQKYLQSNTTGAEGTLTNALSAFNSDGFEVMIGSNNTGDDQASWTFRKAPKFFDVVTYTGDGVNGREIAHNLGSTPGMIIIKNLDNDNRWYVWHNSFANNEYLYLNETFAKNNYGTFAYLTADPTSTTITIGSDTAINSSSGYRYVAYLFAHNDGDGGFGPDGDADIIKCGSYTGNGSTNGPEIDLGFEPQWLLVKNASGVSNWLMVDNMRGFPVGSNNARLFSNLSNAEAAFNGIDPTATGFKLVNSTGGYNTSGNDYIYIAIRRGTKVPESGDEVFAADDETYTNLPQFYSGWPVDFALRRLGKSGSNFTRVIDRLRGNKYLNSTSTAAEASLTIDWDVMDGFSVGTSSSADDFSWMWKRAPNFFDVVAYTGNGTAGRTVSHNLGVAPEMMWVKRRDGTALWFVYSTGMGNAYSLNLDDGRIRTTGQWNSTNPTEDVFTLGSSSVVNGNGDTYVAYLFATLDGVSKVGSYTGNGSSKTIDCSFTSGARFVLIKRFDIDNTDPDGDWYVWDTERGIVAGNDPHLSLNTEDAEVTTDDSVDPVSSGFKVNQVSATNINVSSAEYIFYAIA